MTGTIQNKNGKWHVVIDTKVNGKRKLIWKSTKLSVGKKSDERRANEIKEELLVKYRSDARLLEEGISLSEYTNRWLNLKKSLIQETTYDSYFSMLNKHIIPYFERLNLTVRDLSVVDVQRYYNSKYDEGLSPNTVIKHHQVIHSILELAKREHLIMENVSKAAERKAKVKPDLNFYSEKELQNLINEVKGTEIEIPVILATFLGVRRSEALGIRWSSIDFELKKLAICHKIVNAKNEDGKTTAIASDELKTQASRRTFDLDDNLYLYLQEVKKRQEENRVLCGRSYNKEYLDYVCVNEMGDLIKPDYVSHKFKKILDWSDLKKIRFHDLRHSCASLLLEKKYGIKEIQIYLGHADYRTTANTYTDVLDTTRKKMSEAIGGALTL